MEPDPYEDCERDEDGNVLDPSYFTPIPPERLIVVREGNLKWCMDIQILLEGIVSYNRTTNLLTTNPLSQSVLNQIAAYRLKQIKSIMIVDVRKNIFKGDAILSITMDSFYLVGDLHVACILKVGGVITAMQVILGSLILHEENLDKPISDLTNEKLITVEVEPYNIIGNQYRKLKAFVTKYDRYKFLFSPFPAEVGTRTRPPSMPTRSSRGTGNITIPPTRSIVPQRRTATRSRTPTSQETFASMGSIDLPTLDENVPVDELAWIPIGPSIHAQVAANRDNYTIPGPYRWKWDLAEKNGHYEYPRGYQGELMIDIPASEIQALDDYDALGDGTMLSAGFIGRNALARARAGLELPPVTDQMPVRSSTTRRNSSRVYTQ